MKRQASDWLPRALLALLLAAGAAWFVTQTEWVDVETPIELSPELRADGSLLARQFVQRLGARVQTTSLLTELPAPGATLVLTARHWQLGAGDTQRLHRWVADGGHLVVDAQFFDEPPEGNWFPLNPLKRAEADHRFRAGNVCRVLAARPAASAGWTGESEFVACLNRGESRSFVPHLRTVWELVNEAGDIEAQRVSLGRGRVTGLIGHFGFEWQGVPRGLPAGVEAVQLRNFSNRGLLEGDNAALLAALVDARPGGEIWFFNRLHRPPLLLWLWQQLAPALVLAALALLLGLWRAGTRFGPVAAEPPSPRRSIRAQVDGLADFIFSRKSTGLHAAALRALHEAATTHVGGWSGLTPAARTQALAQATRLPFEALERAQQPTVPRDGAAWTDTLALLETARRELLQARPLAASAVRAAAIPGAARTSAPDSPAPSPP